MASEIPLTPKRESLRKGIGGEGGMNNNNNGKLTSNLLASIPLMPPPSIDCSNLGNLENTPFVNVVLEGDGIESESSNFFRVSDENNEEICRVFQCSRRPNGRNSKKAEEKRGITYLECIDRTRKTVLLIGYPVGLGEVALLSPNEELIGECQSNVDFHCLSVKVKYNYYDVCGNRLMKMTGFIPEEKSDRAKFLLMVKRSKEEKLALVKMGSMKKCCHIKFKPENAKVLDRLQIISLWIGFMHNDIEDKDNLVLMDKYEEIQRLKKSQRKKFFHSHSVQDEVQEALPNSKEMSSTSPNTSAETQSEIPSPSPLDESPSGPVSPEKGIKERAKSLKKLVKSRILPSSITTNNNEIEKTMDETKAVEINLKTIRIS